MKKTSPFKKLLSAGSLCYIFGHDYLMARKANDKPNKYKCTFCGRVAINEPITRLEKITDHLKNYR